jgi:hypothetical protein
MFLHATHLSGRTRRDTSCNLAARAERLRYNCGQLHDVV